MKRDELIALIAAAFERAKERLRIEMGEDDPWPEDLRADDIVRLLRERSRQVIAKLGRKDENR